MQKLFTIILYADKLINAKKRACFKKGNYLEKNLKIRHF
jgi:hypothetical protein